MLGGGLISQALSSGDRVLGQGLIASAMCTKITSKKPKLEQTRIFVDMYVGWNIDEWLPLKDETYYGKNATSGFRFAYAIEDENGNVIDKTHAIAPYKYGSLSNAYTIDLTKLDENIKYYVVITIVQDASVVLSMGKNRFLLDMTEDTNKFILCPLFLKVKYYCEDGGAVDLPVCYDQTRSSGSPQNNDDFGVTSIQANKLKVSMEVYDLDNSTILLPKQEMKTLFKSLDSSYINFAQYTIYSSFGLVSVLPSPYPLKSLHIVGQDSGYQPTKAELNIEFLDYTSRETLAPISKNEIIPSKEEMFTEIRTDRFTMGYSHLKRFDKNTGELNRDYGKVSWDGETGLPIRIQQITIYNSDRTDTLKDRGYINEILPLDIENTLRLFYNSALLKCVKKYKISESRDYKGIDLNIDNYNQNIINAEWFASGNALVGISQGTLVEGAPSRSNILNSYCEIYNWNNDAVGYYLGFYTDDGSTSNIVDDYIIPRLKGKYLYNTNDTSLLSSFTAQINHQGNYFIDNINMDSIFCKMLSEYRTALYEDKQCTDITFYVNYSRGVRYLMQYGNKKQVFANGYLIVPEQDIILISPYCEVKTSTGGGFWGSVCDNYNKYRS